MKTLKSVTRDYVEVGDVKEVVCVYEELAAKKMQEIRVGIESSRDFFDGLIELSNNVGADLSEVNESKGKACVFVSADEGLYGDIIERIFSDFLKFIKTNDRQVFVVGKVGKSLMDRFSPDTKYTVLEVTDKEIEQNMLSTIKTNLIDFDEINVYYARFESIANQHPHMSTITSKDLEQYNLTSDEVEKIRLKYIYEPSVVSISNFLSKEVLMSTMEAMLKEDELARFGSRLMHLDAALENIDERLHNLIMEKRRVVKRMRDKRQRQTLLAQLW